jgi:hypothetical protein
MSDSGTPRKRRKKDRDLQQLIKLMLPTSYELDTQPLWPALDDLMTSSFDGTQWR